MINVITNRAIHERKYVKIYLEIIRFSIITFFSISKRLRLFDNFFYHIISHSRKFVIQICMRIIWNQIFQRRFKFRSKNIYQISKKTHLHFTISRAINFSTCLTSKNKSLFKKRLQSESSTKKLLEKQMNNLKND